MAEPDNSLADSPPKKERIPEIDGLRGVAIIGVLIFHLFGDAIDREHSHWFVNALADISLQGSHGVTLFFVISGFLIGGILIDNRDSPNYLRTFYIRRVFRIFPLYYGLIVAYYILSHANANQLISFPPELLGFSFSSKWYLIFAQNIPIVMNGSFGAPALAPTWSLAVEEQFYLLAPWFFLFVKGRALLPSVLMIAFSGLVFRIVIWQQTGSEFAVQFLLPGSLDALMLGVLLALIVRNPKLYQLLLKIRLRFLLASLIFVLYVVWPLSHTLLGIVFNPHGLEIAKTYISFTAFIMLIAAVTAERNGWISKFLANPVLRRIGDLSYFVYLFHIAVFLFVSWIFGTIGKQPFDTVYVLRFTLTILVTFALAEISFRYIETPFIRFGHRWKY